MSDNTPHAAKPIAATWRQLRTIAVLQRQRPKRWMGAASVTNACHPHAASSSTLNREIFDVGRHARIVRPSSSFGNKSPRSMPWTMCSAE